MGADQAAAKAAAREAKAAAKEAQKVEKAAARETQKANKVAAKEAQRANKIAAKEAQKAQKVADKAAEKAKKAAVRDAAIAAKAAAKEAKDAVAEEDLADDDEESRTCIVKMKLNTFITTPQLRKHIQTLVSNMDLLLGQAYLFANFHIIRVLEDNEPLPKIDRNFYYRCLVACARVRDGKRAQDLFDNSLITSLNAFDVLRTPDEERINIVGLAQVIADMSISMATMAKNHLVTNLKPRLTLFMRWCYSPVKRRINILHKALFEDRGKLVTQIFPKSDAKSLQARQIVSTLRDLLPCDCERSVHRLLPLYAYILRRTEEEIATRTASGNIKPEDAKKRFSGKSFTLLPTKSGFTHSYIAISNMSFMGLLKTAKLETFVGDGRAAPHRELWDKHCNLKAAETRHRTFDLRILTDGYGVSLQLERSVDSPCKGHCCHSKLNDKACCQFADDDQTRKVGIDPGITDVVTGVTAKGEVFSYSSARYYHDGKINYSNRRTNKWNVQTEDLMVGLGTDKTQSSNVLKLHIEHYLKIQKKMQTHRLKYRHLRFLRFVNKQKVVEQICDMIAPKDQFTLVFFGDWRMKGSCPIARRCSGPVRAVREALGRRQNVEARDVDEYLSSMTCCECAARLTLMTSKTDGTRKRIHKVLHCRGSDKSVGHSPTFCCGMTWSRDVNAARNILRLGLYELYGFRRPDAFLPVWKRVGVENDALMRSTTPPFSDCGNAVLRTPQIIAPSSLRSRRTAKGLIRNEFNSSVVGHSERAQVDAGCPII